MNTSFLNKLTPLNIFYEEPDADRWIKFDNYPRRLIRRIIRGKSKPGGVMMVALNLMKGLDRLKIPYRFNDYKYIKKNPDDLACIIGKPHLIYNKKWENPVVFGAGVFSHPVDCLDFFNIYPNVKRILVPGPWMQDMFLSYYKNNVITWATGIDTTEWSPFEDDNKFDFLIYDKIRWEHDKYNKALINPIIQILENEKLNYQYIKYGSYSHAELKQKLSNSKAVIFLCEHETQGVAYQQILSTNTPILAWDRGGYWEDPSYYPEIKFEPVSSVPYWDKRCGLKFTDAEDFKHQLKVFQSQLQVFNPRAYISDHLTLEKCAKRYVEICNDVMKELS